MRTGHITCFLGVWFRRVLLGGGLLVLGVHSFLEVHNAYSQSRSSEEERLRSELLAALAAGQVKRPEDLRRFYVRPAEIPYRSQKNVNREAAQRLGAMLFFDPRLSTSGTISCATCHDPAKYWVDGRAQSTEGNSRRSMALYNLAWDSCYTWHCLAGSLMSQSVMAMTAPKGMAALMTESAPRLRNIPRYKSLFDEAFPGRKESVSPEAIAAAIEFYVSSITSSEAPFDRWVRGDDEALSASAKRGFLAFHTVAPCAQCHNLWRFSDSRRYDIGLRHVTPGRPALYKSVGLRNISERAPYMHDGSLKSLPEVLSFYGRGGDVDRPTKSKMIRPLSLSLNDETDIILFLRSLSGPAPADKAQPLPPQESEGRKSRK